jgi:tetratricopeptide (TPR) repeat protein
LKGSLPRKTPDNLTKALLERGPVAAGPGAQQAVVAAVKSIAEGAEAGDNRLENALSLLKENKTAEAAQLLTAVAEDKKTARIEQDRKEAAIAYRNLGAIAGLRDPKAAREAYARAMALDPGNAGWQRDLSVSYIKVGGVQEAQGNFAGALKSYSDSLAIADRLAKSDPGNSGWQYDLGISNERIGNVQMAQGDLGAALRSYEARQAIISRLATSDPGNAGWQYDLGISNERIGNVQWRREISAPP